MKWFAVIILILELPIFYNSNAMLSSEFQMLKKQEMIPAVLYVVLIEPEQKIIQVPCKQKVKFDTQVGRKIKVNGKKISFDTPSKTVKQILSASYNIGFDKIDCIQCLIPVNDFEEMFSTISSYIEGLSRNLREKITDIFSFFDD